MKRNHTNKTRGQILWVEDEIYYTRSLILLIEDMSGYKVLIAETCREAIEHIKNPSGKISAVVLDVMMDPGDTLNLTETHAGYRTGLALARRIRELEHEMPILAVTASSDPEVYEWFSKQPKMSILHKPVRAEEVLHQLTNLIGERGKCKQKPSIFIVHGHDDKSKLELKNFIQNTLRLGEPFILHEQPNCGRTIIEKFEYSSAQVDVVFVIFTPDDIGASVNAENSIKRRARQNVIFELGYFYGKLQRTKGQVILLHKGAVELPSDIVGVIYIDITNGIEEAGEEIRRELSAWL